MPDQLSMLSCASEGDPCVGALYQHTPTGVRIKPGFVTPDTVICYPVSRRARRIELMWPTPDFLKQFVRAEG